MLVDSHCHLSSPDVYEQLDDVMKRASESNVGFVLNAGGRFHELPLQLNIAERFKNTATVVGVHPHDSEKDQTVSLEKILESTKDPRIVAIGECGLDYFYDYSPRDIQINVFKTMITAAQESALPLIVHIRAAEDDAVQILRDSYLQKPFACVIHCYNSPWFVAETALELGFYLSASGMLTFHRADQLRHNFKKIPLEKLLVETDSPYLAPKPHRGHTNEPSFVCETAKRLAELKNVDFDTISTITTDNFFNLFTKARKIFEESQK